MMNRWKAAGSGIAWTAAAAVLAAGVSFSSVMPAFAAQSGFAGGSGTAEDPWHIRTAAQFNNIRTDLDGYYVLDSDIDLSAYENFEPIGTYEEAEGTDEQADAAYAFSGALDGNGHTVSNLTMTGSVPMIGYGMFGVVSGDAVIRDLNVENVDVTGTGGNGGIGGVIGLVSGDALIDNVNLIGDSNKVTGNSMVGGLIGSANNKVIRNCTATADVTLTGDRTGDSYPQCAAVLVGGDEGASLINDHVVGGSVTTVGKVENETGVNGIGGLAGCAMASPYVMWCSADDVTIQAGDYTSMIGGLVGFSGRTGGEKSVIRDCVVSGVTISAPDTAERIGGIIGGGFYMTVYQRYYAVPTSMDIVNCYAAAEISGGRVAGSVAGYLSDDSTVTRSYGAVTLKGKALTNQVGGTVSTVSIDQVGGK